MNWLGVDIGGTKIAAVVIEADGTVVERSRLESRLQTPQDLHDALTALSASLDTPFAGVGIGAAGIVTPQGRYIYGPNTGLRDVDLVSIASEALGVPAVADNDANTAAWGEFRFGTGSETSHFIVVTLGTGLGGGIIIDGQLLRGHNGAASEIGHVPFRTADRLCGCGNDSCLELWVCGPALAHRAGVGTGEEAVALARQGNPGAVEAVTGMARDLGTALGGLINTFDPEVIAVSGGLSAEWDLFAAEVEAAAYGWAEASEARPVARIVAAQLGPEAGAIGAAALAIR